MDITIKINCDNAAFEDGQPREEVARILEELAGKLRGSAGLSFAIPLKDSNGNKVGEAYSLGG